MAEVAESGVRKQQIRLFLCNRRTQPLQCGTAPKMLKSSEERTCICYRSSIGAVEQNKETCVMIQQSSRKLNCGLLLCLMLPEQSSVQVRFIATNYTSYSYFSQQGHEISDGGVCGWTGSISKKTGLTICTWRPKIPHCSGHYSLQRCKADTVDATRPVCGVAAHVVCR